MVIRNYQAARLLPELSRLAALPKRMAKEGLHFTQGERFALFIVRSFVNGYQPVFVEKEISHISFRPGVFQKSRKGVHVALDGCRLHATGLPESRGPLNKFMAGHQIPAFSSSTSVASGF